MIFLLLLSCFFLSVSWFSKGSTFWNVFCQKPQEPKAQQSRMEEAAKMAVTPQQMPSHVEISEEEGSWRRRTYDVFQGW